MGLKINLRVLTKNRATDSKIGFLTKSIFKPYDRAEAMPPAWELMDHTKGNTNLYFSRI